MMISFTFALLQASAEVVTADENFATALELNVLVGELIAVTSKVLPIDHMSLSKKWKISPVAAVRTVRHTKQLGIRTISNSSLSWRFRIND